MQSMFKDVIVINIKGRTKTTKDISKMTAKDKRKQIAIRDANIVKQFKLGATQEQLAEIYELSKTQISVIWRASKGIKQNNNKNVGLPGKRQQ